MQSFSYECLFIDKVFNEENIIAVFSLAKNPAQHSSTPLNCTTFSLQNSFESWKSGILNRIQSGSLVWGAAGKGVTSLNLLELTNEVIDAAIDINPNIWGKFIPGTGIKIISPAQAVSESPTATIYIMNPLYKEEIANLTGKLGHTGQLETFF